jgi:hypothetical protein
MRGSRWVTHYDRQGVVVSWTKMRLLSDHWGVACWWLELDLPGVVYPYRLPRHWIVFSDRRGLRWWAHLNGVVFDWRCRLHFMTKYDRFYHEYQEQRRAEDPNRHQSTAE